jgi:hypothetical protein
MTPPPVSPRRPADVVGIVAVVLATVVILPSLFVFLVGLLPDMNAIWWLGLFLIPVVMVGGPVVVVVAVIGLIVAARRGGRRAWSIVALGLGILMLVPYAFAWFASLS